MLEYLLSSSVKIDLHFLILVLFETKMAASAGEKLSGWWWGNSRRRRRKSAQSQAGLLKFKCEFKLMFLVMYVFLFSFPEQAGWGHDEAESIQSCTKSVWFKFQIVFYLSILNCFYFILLSFWIQQENQTGSDDEDQTLSSEKSSTNKQVHVHFYCFFFSSIESIYYYK